jgi:hypothetical protein
MEHNTNQAKEFLRLLTGSSETPVTWQMFYDVDKTQPHLARTLTSTLDEALPLIQQLQAQNCGVYAAVNIFNGNKRANNLVTGYRAVFADFDGIVEPIWGLMPHFTQARDKTHGHAFWLISDIENNAEFSAIQMRIALFHETDKAVCDPARVMRVAGFNHCKNPENITQYSITNDNTDGDHKYTKQEIIDAMPLTAKQDAVLNAWANKSNSIDTGTGYKNNESYNNQFKQWLTNIAPIAIQGNGSHTVIKVASWAHDRGILLETATNLMWEHYNPRCAPPWDISEQNQFNDIVKNAYQYAKSAAGCKTATAQFKPVTEPLEGWEANNKRNDKVPKTTAVESTTTNYSIDYLTPLPSLNLGNHKPIRTHENLTEICKRLNVIIRYNVIAKAEEILIPNMGFTKDNEANATLAWLKSESAKFNYNPEWVDGFVTYLAEKNKYNPAVNWIESKAWDGQDRLSLLLNTVVSYRDNELKNILITRWLISAVVAAYSLDGISAQGILVFQGEQSIGKTRWFNGLVPNKLNLTKDGVLLRPDDKDSVKQACSNWLVELGEIDSTFRKSDVAQLKAFVTSDMDVLRMPYAKRESKFARRTVFFGSVNPTEFLADETGNRRYWTVPCKSIEHSHSIDMQQVWAQVKSLVDKGDSYYLSEQELKMLNTQNEEHSRGSPIEDLVFSNFDWDSPIDKWKMLTATQILKMCCISQPNNSETREVSALIKKHNGNATKRTGGARLILTPPFKGNPFHNSMTM